MRKDSTFLLGSSARDSERVAASRTMPSSPASLLSCHGLSLRSRRTEEWPLVASTSQRHQLLVFHFLDISFHQKLKIININVKEHRWSRPLRLAFLFLEVNQQKANLLPSRHLASKIARSRHYRRPVIDLGLSSSPLRRHSLLYVGGGGWGSPPPQIASRSM